MKCRMDKKWLRAQGSWFRVRVWYTQHSQLITHFMKHGTFNLEPPCLQHGYASAPSATYVLLTKGLPNTWLGSKRYTSILKSYGFNFLPGKPREDNLKSM